jgi:hypothetical protein
MSTPESPLHDPGSLHDPFISDTFLLGSIKETVNPAVKPTVKPSVKPSVKPAVKPAKCKRIKKAAPTKCKVHAPKKTLQSMLASSSVEEEVALNCCRHIYDSFTLLDSFIDPVSLDTIRDIADSMAKLALRIDIEQLQVWTDSATC